MANYLWTFVDTPISLSNPINPDNISPSTVSLPEIQPALATAKNTSTVINSTPNIINVVRDFYWTYSKLDEGRQEVPAVILTERKLRTNALVSQLKYSLGEVRESLPTVIKTNTEKYVKDDTLKKFILGTAENIETGLATTDKFLKNIPGYGDDVNPTVNSSNWLKPYRNLYLTDPTNWIYKLPYFDNNFASQSNSFTDTGGVGGVGNILQNLPVPKVGNVNAVGLVTEGAELASSISNFSQITYIEKTKFYNYPADGEDINIDFPLINTGEVTYDDVVRNWQFLFLLLYQNRPGKTSINTVDQPVIYQAEVPGIKFFPFCYMTNLTIDFVGSRREMKITIPSNNSFTAPAGTEAGQYLGITTDMTSIKAVIPDAYRVRITLKSMTANSKNFMQHLISNHNIVETGFIEGT